MNRFSFGANPPKGLGKGVTVYWKGIMKRKIKDPFFQ